MPRSSARHKDLQLLYRSFRRFHTCGLVEEADRWKRYYIWLQKDGGDMSPKMRERLYSDLDVARRVERMAGRPAAPLEPRRPVWMRDKTLLPKKPPGR